MIRKEIYESYGIRLVWRPEHYVELSEGEARDAHRFAEICRRAFDEYGGNNAELEGDHIADVSKMVEGDKE